MGEALEEPRWLTESMVLAIHAQQIERFGGAHGVRDANLVRAALGRPINRWAYQETTDLSDLAAAYLVGLGRSQGFVDGNKRTALASGLVFLRLNGHALHVEPKEVYAVTMQAETGSVEDAAVATYLRERIRPEPLRQ